jgi:UDP-glucuronate decarboxylase
MPARNDAPTPVQRWATTGETVAVTGATGWFGRVTLDLLGRVLTPQAFHDRVRGYASTAREVDVDHVGTVRLRPLSELLPADMLLHYAFVTTTRVSVAEHDGFVAANAAITARVAAAIRTGTVRRFLVTSSGSAHDADLQRNPYGTLKWFDELLFSEACRRAGATCVVARVFNVAGPHMTRPEAYALGDLIGRVQAGRPLELAARGDVVRSYVGVEEVVQVALGELLDGRDAVFETGGAAEVEIEGLARAIRRVLGREDLPVLRRRDPTAPANRYVGDGALMCELAVRHRVAVRGLDDLIRATATGLRA